MDYTRLLEPNPNTGPDTAGEAAWDMAGDIEVFDDAEQLLGQEVDPATGAAVVSAGAALASLGFEIVTRAISPFTTGDLRVTKPAGQIGVTLPGKANVRWAWTRRSMLVIDHRSRTNAGIESVRVKMRCNISYNGPEVLASFGFDVGGRRSRLGRDTQISINNPLPLMATPAPERWHRFGVRYFPIIEIPIEFRVDHPWPTSNREETFSLVLSGNRGFGSAQHRPIIRRRVART